MWSSSKAKKNKKNGGSGSSGSAGSSSSEAMAAKLFAELADPDDPDTINMEGACVRRTSRMWLAEQQRYLVAVAVAGPVCTGSSPAHMNVPYLLPLLFLLS
jgi:hypothetical protein